MLTPITSDLKEAPTASPAPSLLLVLVTDWMSGLELARKIKCFATELNPLSQEASVYPRVRNPYWPHMTIFPGANILTVAGFKLQKA